MEGTIRERQKGYYAAPAKSDAAGSSEAFVEFVLEAIRDTLLPYANPSGVQDVARKRTLAYFESNPKGNLSALAAELGGSKRTAARIVSGLKESGALERIGSAQDRRCEVNQRT